MPSVDDRIVNMQFDNAAFEKRVADTIKSLDKLQSSLEMANAKKGLEDVSTAASKFSMEGMAGAVDGIASKFTSMGAVAFTVLQNITNRVVDAGVQMAKSLSVQPIMEGFKEYELNMGSIQTILANTKDKGSNLQNVNDALDQLNTYSDKTIYNFGQMAKNIGTFTAAGVSLDESVKSIKGISNLAAISGSTSDQASTAMYQLSQALSAGKVNLMDWNSVVNAGMGGEVFKKALFETGKAMKTITDVPLGASFEEWEKQGGTFREQMQNGWLTADVLATTLQGFSGDLDEAGLKALGFGDAAAKKMVELGKTGLAAATEVKTMSQLMQTLKEGVASGWSASFRTIIGDFEQSKKLFTDINAAVGGALGKSADVRNEMLKAWADFGGRTTLIEAFKDAFSALGSVINAFKMAFRGVFPPVTAATLLKMTAAFAEFTEHLRNAVENVLPKLVKIFAGVFAAIEIVITVVKELGRFFIGLFKDMFPDDGGGKILDFFVKIAGFLTDLNEKLVAGGGIRAFFDGLTEKIRKPIESLQELKDKIVDFFQSFSGTDAVGDSLGRFGSRFDGIRNAIDKLSEFGKKVEVVFDKVVEVLDKLWGYVSTWFSELGQKLAAVMKPGDFDAAVDIVNVGLLAGIFFAMKKFLNQGLALFSGGGLVEKASGVLDILKIRLKQMQNVVKADILLKIAAAVGILAASALVLSMIDSAALTKAMIALGVGFAQLTGSMALLDKIGSGPTGTAKLAAMGATMVAMSTSMLILTGAIKVLSTLDVGDLAKGLVGLTAGLAVMIGAMHLMSTNAKGLLAGSIAMNAMATSMVILAGAVKAFATISWDEMGRGLFGLAVALGIIVVAMNLMPIGGTLAAGLAMIPLAIGLGMLAGVVKLFSLMKWEEMGKGFFGIGVGLALIAVTMSAMPPTLPLTAAGLILVGIALIAIAKAIEIMGSMKFGDVAKGVGAIAVTLIVLAVALNAMTGAMAGAAALIIAAGALVILTQVIKTLGELDIKVLALGLGAIAAVMLVLGVGAYLLYPAIPALLGFAKALMLMGVAFALFGVGVMAVAKGFEILAESGEAGAKAFLGMLKIMIGGMFELLGAFVTSVGEFSEELGAALGLLIKAIVVVLSHLLDAIIELAPKIIKAVVVIVVGIVDAAMTLVPKFVELGFTLLMALLKGWQDNIKSIVNMTIGIITTIAKTLGDNAQKIVDSALELLQSFVVAIMGRMPDIVLMGVALLISFIQGISDNINKLVETVGMLIATFLWSVGSYASQIVRVGADMIISIITGIGSNSMRIVAAGVDTILAFLAGLGANAVKLAEGAADVLVQFLNGMATAIETKGPEIRKAGLNVAMAIVEGITGGLVDAKSIKKVVDGAVALAKGALDAVNIFNDSHSPSRKYMKVGQNMAAGVAIALDRDTTAQSSVVGMAERIVTSFQESLSKTPDALMGIGDINPVITPILDLSKVQAGARGLNALMDVGTISPDLSLRQARLISTTAEQEKDSEPVQTGPSEVNFVQNNYSPRALTTNDIFRKTRSQFALAKEELNI